MKPSIVDNKQNGPIDQTENQEINLIKYQQPVLNVLKGGDLTIGDIKMPCAVLDDKTRLISQRGMSQGLNRYKNPRRGQSSFDDRPIFLAAANLDDHIPEELRKIWSPVLYRSQGGYKGNIAFGYRAEILPLVCGVYIDALEAEKSEKKPYGKLHASQIKTAERCKVLMRALATVGIIALVDEATGYQEMRDRDELNKILTAYISPDLLPWTQRFPDEFYKEMFRLRGWQYQRVARPQYVGKLTNELIYRRLPPGVLEELRLKNPPNQSGNRVHKHHQFLTDNIGEPHLDKLVIISTAFMRASTSWEKFMRAYERAVPIPRPQLDLGLDIADEEEE